MRQIILLITIFLAATPVHAVDLDGRWKMLAEGKTAMLISVDRAPGGGVRATLLRPEGMEIDDGISVSNLSDRAGERTLTDDKARDTRAELRFAPAKAGEEKVRFLLTALDDSHAELVIEFDGQASRPMALRRASPTDRLSLEWEKQTYTITPDWPDNAEMAAMFEADQAARKASKIDWDTLNLEDAKRRARTAQLVAQGKLRSASDFYAAAFIFQHGDQASDFLLAHTYALIAASRGEPGATWIAAATLDRYLQKIGQPQIYGTQYFTRPNEPVTQEPYNRALASDALRAELGVPPIAAQEGRRKAIQASRDGANRR